MPYQRNADEAFRRRERARAAGAPPTADEVVADKLRSGRADLITLGEIAGVTDRELVQSIPAPLWQELLNRVASSRVEVMVPVQLGPVPCMLQISEGGDYPQILFFAKGYAGHDSWVTAVIEHDSSGTGRLRVMVYGDPYDPEGAPSHYINLSPYDSSRPAVAQGDQHVWDAENL